MKDNIRNFKLHKGVGKTPQPTISMPRFIREVRTATSERFSIINGDLENIGTIDLHISESIDATLVIVPEMEQIALELLVGLIKIELFDPLNLDLQSLNIYKGVTSLQSLDENDFFNSTSPHPDCNGDCDKCEKADCSVDEKDESEGGYDPNKDND